MPIETLIHAKQEGYYKALNASNSAGESTIFVVFMLGVIRDALRNVVESADMLKVYPLAKPKIYVRLF